MGERRMKHERCNRPELPEDDGRDRLGSYASFITEDGSGVIYDVDEHTAWIVADHAVAIDSAR